MISPRIRPWRHSPEVLCFRLPRKRIYAYHDQYPKRSGLALAIHQMPAPSIMAAWQGTAPMDFGGMDVWKHQVVLNLRAGETFEGDPLTAYYPLFRLITKGAPASAMKLGVGVSPDEISADESCAMPLIEEERDRLEREQMQSPRN